MRLSEAPLVVNQVEYHPFLAQTEVLGALRRHGAGLGLTGQPSAKYVRQ